MYIGLQRRDLEPHEESLSTLKLSSAAVLKGTIALTKDTQLVNDRVGIRSLISLLLIQ